MTRSREDIDPDDPIEKAIMLIGQRDERGECIHCGTPIDHARQAGRCIYVEPCGHRLGQGDARRFNVALAKKRVR